MIQLIDYMTQVATSLLAFVGACAALAAGYLQQAFEEGRKHGKFEQYEKSHAVA